MVFLFNLLILIYNSHFILLIFSSKLVKSCLEEIPALPLTLVDITELIRRTVPCIMHVLAGIGHAVQVLVMLYIEDTATSLSQDCLTTA